MEPLETNNHLMRKSSLSSHGEECGKQLPKRTKILTAIAIFYGNVAFGCTFGTYIPVLTTLQTKYDTDDATISKVFTIQTGFYMIGALLAGIIFNYVNRQLAVIGILSTMAVMMFLTPHCPTLATFFVTAAISGLTCGSYGTAQFVWIMEMMQKECPPYVQGQHFFFAVGSNLAVLIMTPFLDDKNDDLDTTTMSTRSVSNTSVLWNIGRMGTGAEMLEGESVDHDKLLIPFTIVGLLVSSAVFIQIMLFMFFRYFSPPQETFAIEKEDAFGVLDEKTNPEITGKPFIASWSFPKFRMVALSCCFFAAFLGLEMCTFQFFSKFAQNSELQLSEAKAAYVLTGLTAAYAAGRAVAIIAVFKIPTKLILCINLTLVVIANVLLIGWAGELLPVLWVSSILFGLGLSSTYASYCAFVERYLYFTNFIGSLMLVCGSGVAAIYPLVVGSFIEENPIVLSYVLFFSIAIVVIAFGSVSYLTNRNKTRY